ncbi:MAG: hypothetical protein QOE71_2273 [Pseudonocardiales bacterium]|nr:hypothetical protein [Pseudonocardiales bacterium]
MITTNNGVKPASKRRASPIYRRRLIPLAIALALALSGCDRASSVRPGGGPAASTTNGAATTAPAGRSAAVSTKIPAAAFSKHRPFTGPAVAKYGQATLNAAYQELVNFAFESGWDSRLIVKNIARLSSSDFANIRTYLTPACRTAFNATFARAIQADRAAAQKLEEAVFFDVTAPTGLRPITAGKVVTDRRFTEASVGLTGTGKAQRLTMAFAVKANVHLRNAQGQGYVLPTSRVLRYTLVRNSAVQASKRPFLVDGWVIKMTVGRPVAG